MVKKQFILATILGVTLTMSAWTADLAVQYRCADPSPTTRQILIHLNILNNSAETVRMENLQVRYYYSSEGNVPEIMNIDYATFGSSNVLCTFTEGYMEVGFTSGAGTIISGNSCGEIQLRFHKQDWSAYNQNDDFSFAPENEAYQPNPGIALFHNGLLAWGTTPPEEPDKTPDLKAGRPNFPGESTTPTPEEVTTALETTL